MLLKKKSKQSSFGSSQRGRFARTWNPLFWILWIFEFTWRWLITRPVRHAWPAIPALLGVLALSIVVIDSSVQRESRTRTKNSLQLATAYAEEDSKSALIVLRNLIDQMPDRDDLQIEYALIEKKLDRLESGKARMESLLASNGSTRAAFWLATNTFDLTQIPAWTREQHQQFRKYMAIALKKRDGWSMDDRQIAMAKYLMGVNANKEALNYLSGLVEKRPELSLKASILSAANGTIEETKRYTVQAVEYNQSKLRESPTDLLTRASLVQALVMNNREDQAIEVIAEGRKFGDLEALKLLEADTLITWSHRLKREQPAEESVGSRLELIAEAVKIAPNRPIVMDAVFDIAMEFRTSRDEGIRKQLASTLRSVDPAVLHFVRGTVATLEGDIEKAISHLRLAESFGPSLPVIYNNLAVALGMKNEENYDEALRLVDLAIQRVPDQPYFRETRGQILAKLDRPVEAIRELEMAMAVKDLLPSVLPTIMECYRKVGLVDMETACRLQLKELEKTKSVSAPTR